MPGTVGLTPAADDTGRHVPRREASEGPRGREKARIDEDQSPHLHPERTSTAGTECVRRMSFTSPRHLPLLGRLVRVDVAVASEGTCDAPQTSRSGLPSVP